MIALPGLASAAGARSVETAQAASGGSVQLNVEAACENGNAIFRVTNAGDEWPKAGRFSITRAGDEKVISNRSMRMVSGQQASFRVPASKIGPGEYEISIQPTWYERGKIVDAHVTCK